MQKLGHLDIHTINILGLVRGDHYFIAQEDKRDDSEINRCGLCNRRPQIARDTYF